MYLYELLGIRLNQREVLCFVGAGGKTSSMFILAEELKEMGRKVLATTTTAIYHPQSEQYDSLVLAEGEKPFTSELRAAAGITVMGRARTQEDKLLGVSPAFLEIVSREGNFDYILVEGDGSKGRPVKAPADHEPVIPGCSTKVVGLIGLDCLEKPLEEKYVHRPEVLRSLAGCNSGTIDLLMLARLIQHEKGLYKGAPSSSGRYLVLNKSDLSLAEDRAEQLAAMLLKEGTDISGIILASMKLRTYLRLYGKR